MNTPYTTAARMLSERDAEIEHLKEQLRLCHIDYTNVEINLAETEIHLAEAERLLDDAQYDCHNKAEIRVFLARRKEKL